jgi:hypothetical protein
MPRTVMRVPFGSCSSATSSSVAGPADLPVETEEALGLVRTISPREVATATIPTTTTATRWELERMSCNQDSSSAFSVLS